MSPRRPPGMVGVKLICPAAVDVNGEERSASVSPGNGPAFGTPNAGGFSLGMIAFLGQGGSVGNVISAHLYAINTAPSPSASASYNDTGGHNMGPDLLGGGAGINIPWNPGAPASGHAWLEQIFLDGPDVVPLSSGTTYALEIWSSATSSNNFIWMRRPDATNADPGGQMFGAHNSNPAVQTLASGMRATINQEGLAGGTPRIASLALYDVSNVPEPTTISLFGLAAVGLVARRRRA